MTKDADGYLVLQIFAMSYLWGGRTIKDTYRVLPGKVDR